MKFIKKSVHYLFNSLGYQLVRTRKSPQKWIDVNDPIKHNSIEKINEFYADENLLKDYVTDERLNFYKDVTAFLVTRSLDLKNKKVVDVGCGTGHLLHYIHEKYNLKEGIGLEYSSEAVKLARSLFPMFDFQEFDIYQQRNDKFDVILCTEVLEHLLYPDQALNNLLKMTDAKGKIFITVPNGRIDTFGGHINFWSPESWEVFIKKTAEGYQCETGTIRDNGINYALISKAS